MLCEFSGMAQIAARDRDLFPHYTGVFFDTSRQFDRAMRDAAFSWLTATAAPIGHRRTP